MSSPDEEDHQQVIRDQAAQLPETADSFPKSVADSQDKNRLELTVEQLSNSSTTFTSLPMVKPEGTIQPTESKAKSFSTGQEQTDREDGSHASDAQARLVQAEVHASLENGVKEHSGSSEEKGADSDKREEDQDEEDGSRKDDYSEGDLIDISAYSGVGEDSGDSQLDDEDDEEDEEVYQPETSCCEIPGLPEEEEPPPANRKIKFSTAPITVSFCSDVIPFLTLKLP